ncbi:MAG TPA: hypothetical protein VFW98_15395 [Gemmatimonadaceae bacterium]|nr:hypothetical protein [Gemmatimonadaceae bacterium]
MLACVCALAPTVARAQDNAVRFEITAVGDSTFSFAVGRHDWVQVGERGIAVDPRRRDALVARFVVMHVDHGRATALVTGQTTPVVVAHVALLERPRTPWYRRGVFWLGALIGAVVGVVATSR